MKWPDLRVGDNLDMPYELTVGQGWVDTWHGVFYQHDRLYTSTPYAKTVGFPSQLLPFSFMLFHTAAMAHIDEHDDFLELGMENVVYVRPAYVGDTFRKSYYVKRLRDSNGQTIATVRCMMYNQNAELCFSLDKVIRLSHSTPSEFLSPDSPPAPAPAPPCPTTAPHKPSRSLLLRHLELRAEELPRSTSLAPLRAGQLVLQALARPLGAHTSMKLATLFRQTHPLLLDTAQFSENHLLVTGPLSLALCMASESRSLYEVIYEELTHARFINKVKVNDTVGVMTYVNYIKPLKNNLEEVGVTTVGVRGVAVSSLQGVGIPLSIFETPSHLLSRKSVEATMQAHCPELVDKVAIHAVRKIIRQSHVDTANTPLL